MRLRERFNKLWPGVTEISQSPTPSEMPVNGCFQAPPGFLGKVVPMSSISSKIDRRDKNDVLAMLLPRGSVFPKPQRRRNAG